MRVKLSPQRSDEPYSFEVLSETSIRINGSEFDIRDSVITDWFNVPVTPPRVTSVTASEEYGYDVEVAYPYKIGEDCDYKEVVTNGPKVIFDNWR